MILTYRYRVKNLEGLLNAQARAVNFVWNFCNDRQREAVKWGRRWLTAFDLHGLTSGCSVELGIGAQTINAVCSRYAMSRRQHNRPWLRYRGKKSLGWIPYRADQIRFKNGAVVCNGHGFKIFDSRPIPDGAVLKDGSSFAQDSRGNWFLNLVLDIPAREFPAGRPAVGIDLGLHTAAVLSNGERVENMRPFAKAEQKIARAQRARKKRLARNLSWRVANARRDHLHKASTAIANRYGTIAVGNINASGLAKTSMAKSVNDVGWSSLRFMLRYKAIARGATYIEVDEAFTTQVCSACGCLPASRPRGIADLGIRQWVCSDCRAVHDRDVNAATNILARSGHRAPSEGALAA